MSNPALFVASTEWKIAAHTEGKKW